MRRSTRTAALAAAVVALGAQSSFAEHASVTLRYSSRPAPTTCPDEGTFRGLVAARLGYDPFTGAGSRTLAVDFERRGSEAAGHLSLSAGPDGKGTERTLRAPVDDCFELATSLALVAAVAVDPEAIEGGASPAATTPPAPPPEPVPPPAPAAPPAPAPSVVRTPPPGPGVRRELGALLPVGVVPAPRGGIRTGMGIDFGAASIGAEVQFLFPSTRDNPAGEGEVSAWVIAGSLVPCVAPFGGKAWGLELCAVGSFGVLRSTAEDVTRADTAVDLYATLGPRVGMFVLFSRVVGLGLSAEAPVALSRVHLHIEEGGQRHEVWAMSPVGFIGAVSLVMRLK